MPPAFQWSPARRSGYQPCSTTISGEQLPRRVAKSLCAPNFPFSALATNAVTYPISLAFLLICTADCLAVGHTTRSSSNTRPVGDASMVRVINSTRSASVSTPLFWAWSGSTSVIPSAGTRHLNTCKNCSGDTCDTLRPFFNIFFYTWYIGKTY